MINYSKYTDDQLRKAYKDRCEEYEYWRSSTDGSDGAFWDYEVMPIIREAELRGIDL